jgi:CDP-glucose 4,6-dehydratase
VLPLNSALGWIIEWWRAFEAGGDLRRVTSAQIQRYEALLQN